MSQPSAVKVFGLLPRREDMSRQEFQDHYRHPHGTVGAPLLLLRHYVQSHQIDTDLLGPEQERFSAVAELWFDNEADAVGFRSHPLVMSHIIKDEPTFIDMPRILSVITDEEVIYSFPTNEGAELSYADVTWSAETRPVSIKLLQFIAVGSEQRWATDEDEELGRQIGALRHVRCWPRPSTYGGEPPFLGVRELWWPTKTAFERAAAAAPLAFGRLLGDRRGAITLLAQAERWR